MAETGAESGWVDPLIERKAVDRQTIDYYAARIYHVRLSKLMAADAPMPDQMELWTRTRADIERKYDDSLTLENLHNMVRVANDPEQLVAFLHMLPATVLRDMTVSAEVEAQHKEARKDDIAKVLEFALDTHIKTANATLRLLQRFETVKNPDPDVVYVKKMVTSSRKAMVEEQQSLKAAGVLKED